MRAQRQDLFAGWCAGMGTVTVGYPLDTLKNVLQTSPAPVVSTLRHLIAERGVRGLWRGAAAPLSSAPIFMSLSVATYAAMVSPASPLLMHGVGGFVSGFSQSLLNMPFELVKVRLQISTAAKEASSWATAKAIVRSHGVRGLFPRRALVANAVTLSVGNTLYYTVHEWMQRHVLARREELRLHHRIFVGGLTGVFYWMAIFPLDLMRTRVIADPSLTMRSQLSLVLAAYGVRGMYAGLLPTLIRAFFTNAVFMTTFGLLRADKT